MTEALPLAGLRILVTRPAHQAEGLCRRIAAAGGGAVRLPTLEITPVMDRPAARRQLESGLQADWLVFTSANAVAHAASLLPHLLRRATGRIAAIGAATAAALTHAGRSPDLVPPGEDYRSEGLLAQAALSDMAGQRVMIVRGENGRVLLGDTLRQRGADVTYVPVYRRQCPQIDRNVVVQRLTHPRGPDILVFTSPEALSNLFELVPDGAIRQQLRSAQVVVVSEAMVKQAQNMEFGPPLRAIADEAGLMRTLTRWAQRLHPHKPPTLPT